MKWRRIQLIFLRELRDQLRDRRTLFMIAILPLILYPALGLGMLQMMLLLEEEPQSVAIIHADQLPEPSLLEAGNISPAWLDEDVNPSQFNVTTIDVLAPDESEPARQALHQLIDTQTQIQASKPNQNSLDKKSPNPTDANSKIEANNEKKRAQLLENSGFDVVIYVPQGLRENFANLVNSKSGADPGSADEHDFAPWIFYNVTDEKSQLAHRRFSDVYRRWKEATFDQHLKAAGLPPGFVRSLDAEEIDVANREQHTRSIWSRMLPALLVIMTLTGAFYPAVDLTAGEKERGTIETLLICPATRAEIILGKFLTVTTFAITTALLNLISMGITGQYFAQAVFRETAGAGAGGTAFLIPPISAMVWVGLALIPIAGLFGALSLALATMARGSKEGQYYLTPLLLVSVGLTMFAQMPTVELNPFNSIIPVTGVVLLLKELLNGTAVYTYLAPVLLTSFGYAAIALWIAVEQFQKEEILFRESETFEPGTWIRQLLFRRRDWPTIGAAFFAFFLLMMLQFGGTRLLGWFPSLISDATSGQGIAKLLIIQQLLIVAGPVILMTLLFYRRPVDILRLHRPHLKHLAIALLLALILVPLSTTLGRATEWMFPKLPESVTQVLEKLRTDDLSFIWLLIAMSILPGICEEIAFRGFILSGLLSSNRVWLAILLSAFGFGVMHMIPQQAFNAALLGIVLAIIALASRNLFPGILFHIAYNGLHLVQHRYFIQTIEHGFSWWVNLGCLVTLSLCLYWLVKQLNKNVRPLEQIHQPT